MSEPKKASRWGLRGKTFWDWLQLLVVPLVIALLGIAFTVQQDARQQEIQEQNAQDAALQTYFEQMNRLLLDKGLRDSHVNSGVRTLARAQTLTVLESLDPDRRSQVLRFLIEAELVQGEKEMNIYHPRDTDPIISLRQANLEGVDVVGANLDKADLQVANLSNARLIGASFQKANLIGVNMSGSDLSNGDGDPPGATFGDTDLLDADMSGANLTHASGINEKSLERDNVNLSGTTMPDGTKHP